MDQAVLIETWSGYVIYFPDAFHLFPVFTFLNFTLNTVIEYLNKYKISMLFFSIQSKNSK